MIDPVLLEEYTRTRLDSAGFNTSVQTYDKFCYAPFSSLYFAHEGKVLACCENRDHVLGVYPEKSISEIWNGAAAHALRQYITEKNLGHGCKGCDFDLKSRNFGGVKARSFDYARLQQRNLQYPSMMEFELENTCNLECVMCSGIFSSSIRKNREHLPPISTPYDDEFVRQLEEFIPHLAMANFFGGEPFLVEIYLKIWEKMAQLNPGMNVWVTTNGTVLNNRIVHLLNRIRFNITVSVDSIEKETYEKIRVNASFERVMDNFRRFLRYTKAIGSEFTVNTCPMTLNWRGLPDIVKWGCREGFVVNIIPVRYPEHLSLSSLSASELDGIIDYFRAVEIDAAGKYGKRNRKNFEDYIRFVEQWRQYKGELEGASKEAEKLQPVDEIRKRFRTSLNLTSMTEAEKDEQISRAMEKLLRMNAKFQTAAPYFKETVWKLIFLFKPADLLTSLLTLDDDEILERAKVIVADEIDKLSNGDSEEAVHLARLKLYLEYCEIAGNNAAECTGALEQWKGYLQKLKSENPMQHEALVRAANKNKIAVLCEALLRGGEKAVLENLLSGTAAG